MKVREFAVDLPSTDRQTPFGVCATSSNPAAAPHFLLRSEDVPTESTLKPGCTGLSARNAKERERRGRYRGSCRWPCGRIRLREDR